MRESGVLGWSAPPASGGVLDTAPKLFQWPRSAMVPMVVFAVVTLPEVVVAAVRSRIL